MSNNSTYFDGNSDCLVLCDILSRLPVKSLMRFKCVSKRWERMITRDPYFINLQLRSSETRGYNANNYGTNTSTLLIYPIWPPTSYLKIQRVLFSKDDLSFDDSQGGSSETTVIPSLSCPYFRNDISVSLGIGTQMTKPVYGLVCFVCLDGVSEGRHSVLIYNPSTREKTSWIKTRSKRDAFESVFHELETSKQNYHRAIKFTTQRLINCMFAFGMDPSTKQHKVLFIYTLLYRLTSSSSPVSDHVKVICDVMTVGENIWRKVDYNHTQLDISNGAHPAHVNGSIYWIMSPGKDKDKVVMVFEVGSETFRVILIPNFILDRLLYLDGVTPLVNILVEVDGHLTILVTEGENLLNLWIYSDNDGVTGANWTKETIQMPRHWDEIHYLVFKAITCTDLIIIKFLPGSGCLKYERHQLRECLYYYNRKEKKYYRNQYEMLLDDGGYNGAHHITTFFETLLPVQTIQQNEEIVT